MSVEISEVPIESGVEQVDEDKQIQENTETNENNDPIISDELDEKKKDDEYPDENEKNEADPKAQ